MSGRAAYGALQAHDGQKICSVCRMPKPTTDFRIDRSRADGFCPLCQACAIEKQRAWRAEHPERQKAISDRGYQKNKARILKRSQEYRRRQLARLVAQLKAGRPCLDCGQVFPPCVMDFDHRPGVDKSFGLNGHNLGRHALATVMDEVAKCDLVCANCHRLRTQRRRMVGV